jgi:hypothetical protein
MFCVECKHVKIVNEFPLCARTYSSNTDLVTGASVTSGALKDCKYERTVTRALTCGSEGRFFERKTQ